MSADRLSKDSDMLGTEALLLKMQGVEAIVFIIYRVWRSKLLIYCALICNLISDVRAPASHGLSM